MSDEFWIGFAIGLATGSIPVFIVAYLVTRKPLTTPTRKEL